MTAGVQFAAALVLFTLGGVWLDRRIESLSPLFTILGLLLGFAGATTSLYFKVFPRGNGPKQ
jgi:F0F1-type ATP synthase assembly protein I